jgi:hypothetical protein
MFGLGKLLSATIDTVLLPVDLVRDAADMIENAVADDKKPVGLLAETHTSKRAKGIFKKIEAASAEAATDKLR